MSLTDKNNHADTEREHKRKCTGTPEGFSRQRNSQVGNMNISDLKDLIISSISLLLDDKLKDMPTKSDIASIVVDIQALQQSNSALQSELQQVVAKCNSLERQVEFLESKTNELNIVMHIPTENGVSPTVKAKQVCMGLLETNDLSMVTDTQLIRSRDSSISNVLVKLRQKDDVRRVLVAKNKVRDSGILIHKDYTAATRNRRKLLFELKKDINNKVKSLKIDIRGQTLSVEGKSFYYDRNNNLRCEGKRNAE